MRIIFWGTPAYALFPLSALTEREEVVAVVCQPDKPQGRGLTPKPPAVKEFATARGIPVLQPEDLKAEEFQSTLRELSPHICVVCAYGRIIPPQILSIPSVAFINFHPSLLPRWRGADPIRWAILAGDEKTGVTIHHTTERLDSGDIILQKEFPLYPDDTWDTLTQRLFKEGTPLLLDAIELLKRGEAPRVPQKEELATYAPPLKREDFRINWEERAEKVERLIRAGNSTPGAFTFFRGKRIKIFKGKVVEGEAGTAGEVIEVGKEGVVVRCGNKGLLLEELQMEGKRRISGEEFVRGYRPNVRERFS